MNKSDEFYFKNLNDAAACSSKAAGFLYEALAKYKIVDAEKLIKGMHEIENEGDELRHKMGEELSSAFITPLDREDLNLLSHNIDEVTDSLEEVLQRIYISGVDTLTTECIEFAELVCKCCMLLCDTVAELKNFKKPRKILDMIININRLEEDCDDFYIRSSVKLLSDSKDALFIVTWREIYDYIEKCADACEHVADCIGEIIMKNT